MSSDASSSNVTSESPAKDFNEGVCVSLLDRSDTLKFAKRIECSRGSIADALCLGVVPPFDDTLAFLSVFEELPGKLGGKLVFSHAKTLGHTRSPTHWYGENYPRNPFRRFHPSTADSCLSGKPCLPTHFCWSELLAFLIHGRNIFWACHAECWTQVHVGK